jgi:hypothetical protein
MPRDHTRPEGRRDGADLRLQEHGRLRRDFPGGRRRHDPQRNEPLDDLSAVKDRANAEAFLILLNCCAKETYATLPTAVAGIGR